VDAGVEHGGNGVDALNDHNCGPQCLWNFKGQRAEVETSVPFQFIWLAVVGFVIAGLMNVVAVLPERAR